MSRPAAPEEEPRRPLSVLARFPARLSSSPSGRAALARLARAAYRVLERGGHRRGLDIVVRGTRGTLRPDGSRLAVSKAYLLSRPSQGDIEARVRKALPRLEPEARPAPRFQPGRARALFFRCLLNSPDKEGDARFHQGVFYIVSALKEDGLPFSLSESRISLEPEGSVTRLEELDGLLSKGGGPSFVGVTLYDSYFEKAAALMRRVRERCGAFIAAGGIMPTTNPLETLVHIPEVNLIVRGAGEKAVPAFLRAAGAAGIRAGLDSGALEALRELEGVFFLQRDALLLSGPSTVLRVPELDRSKLDFSILSKRDVRSGVVLSMSRGCRNACLFCTSFDQGRFAGKTPRETARCLADYGNRLKKLYGRWSRVPPAALGLGFYDDDFLGDRDRAIEIFRLIRKSPFHIKFFQAAVRSFFRGDRLDKALLDAMPEELFRPRFGARAGDGGGEPAVYIGTESFSDRELARLRKGYRVSMVERLARELSRRRVRQAHHWIVTNSKTSLEDVLESLVRIARLRLASGGFFDVLRPVIPNLVSFYPSASYRKLAAEGSGKRLQTRGTLSVKGYPEFDYPLVEKDLPADPDVWDLADCADELFTGEWDEVLSKVLSHLLRRSEELSLEERRPARARRLRRLADKYARFPEMVAKGAPRP